MGDYLDIQFCHIGPTSYLPDFVAGRNMHLVLAHLIERDEKYAQFYKNESAGGAVIIMDNSGFEMYKQGRPMFDGNKLVDLANRVDAHYIVMPDYPAESGQKTIDAAREFIPRFKDNGFSTFFVPQSPIGHFDDYLNTLEWGISNPNVDIIGLSILGIPNAFGNIEKDNKLQRFLARWRMFKALETRGLLTDKCAKRFHMLGMLDGPMEIELVREFHKYIRSWDSSSAIWHGINDIRYDFSPTGLINGKLEDEVDFDAPYVAYGHVADNIRINMSLIDTLCQMR